MKGGEEERVGERRCSETCRCFSALCCVLRCVVCGRAGDVGRGVVACCWADAAECRLAPVCCSSPDAVHTDLYDQMDIIPFDKIADFMNTYLK